MRIAMIGGTGLVGSRTIARLVAEGWSVDGLQRRTSGLAHPGWREHLAAPDSWPGLVAALAPDAAVSAVGTTMRQAGSEAAFRAVDLDLVVRFAAAAAAAGARRLVVVSSVGADDRSSNFYLRTKGEMERAVESIGFERLDIMRPGLLRGPRGGDRRPGERIGIALSPAVNLFLRGRFDRFAAIDADDVAAAIAGALRQSGTGTYRHHNREIGRMA